MFPRMTTFSRRAAWLALLLVVLSGVAPAARGQDLPAGALDEAARRAGLSSAELARRLGAAGDLSAVPADTAALSSPGRAALPEVILPLAAEQAAEAAAAAARAQAAAAARAEATQARADFFGADFFRLEPGIFNPATFGPVPEDYLLGPGDQVVVDVWGEIEFRHERVIDRDGTIILPKGGRVACANRTLAQVERAVREALARSHSGLATPAGEETTFLRVSLGSLRQIRVYVVGDAVQPGAYELSGMATVFTALYAAGGPAAEGSWRDIRLLRGEAAAGSLDIYRYLLEGRREGDAILREGDTVFIPPRGKTAALRGEVRRPLRFELREGEGLAELLRFGGGLTPLAATERVHLERIVPPAQRRAEHPDRVARDILLDPATGQPRRAGDNELRDGDVVTVGAISQRLENWVRVEGNVKRPGQYEHRPDLDVAALIALAGGLWPDTLEEKAIIDRTEPDGAWRQISVPLGEVLAGLAPAVPLAPRDVLRVYSRWDVADRYQVAISGEVRAPGAYDFRAGMTLSDLLLKAGGLLDSADAFKAEVSRLRLGAVENPDPGAPPQRTVDVITVPLGEDYLRAGASFPLEPRDRVAVRRLPWWELQRTVTVRGEVHYPGIYSLERPDERLSDLIARAGGLKRTAFAPGARVARTRDGAGNIAIDLAQALRRPHTPQDIVLAAGDEVLVPELQHTVRVTGAVGFPTSLVYERGHSMGRYVDRAGGYADNADKWKTHVVYPNGLSRPIKRIWRDPPVMAGSTIVVPVKPEREGRNLETLKDIAAILASVATVYLVIDRTAN